MCDIFWYLGSWFFFSSYVICDLVNGNFLTLLKFSLVVHFFVCCCQGKKLMVIGTTSKVGFLDCNGYCDAFSVTCHLPTLKTDDAKKVKYFCCRSVLVWKIWVVVLSLFWFLSLDSINCHCGLCNCFKSLSFTDFCLVVVHLLNWTWVCGDSTLLRDWNGQITLCICRSICFEGFTIIYEMLHGLLWMQDWNWKFCIF